MGADNVVNPGCFIVIEGIDGSGKSTQLRLLAERLRAAGHDVVVTREPYEGGEYGPRIRAMARSGVSLDPEEELRWFVEQRREHVRDVITPALSAGRTVLCDRYFLSSVAYQGARGLDAEAILRESEGEFPVPDRVVVIDVPVEAGIGRVASRGGVAEPVFEERAFQERVREVFLGLARPYLVVVDGTGSEAEVAAAVAAAVDRT